MNSKTRKRIWPVSLVMAFAVIGMMALIVLSTNTGSAQAQGLCDTASGATLEALIAAGVCQDDSTDPPADDGLCDTATGATLQALIDSGVCQDEAAMAMVTSSSTSGSATVELKLTVELMQDVPVGGAIVLYLEDDYQEPDSISASDVYFVVTPSSSARADVTGNGARVYATQAPEIDTDDHFTKDKKDIDIRVSVPDLCTTDTPDCQGQNGLMSGDTVTLVVQKSAGIKNPSEEGKHSTGYLTLGPADSIPSSAAPDNQPFVVTNVLPTWAKISISDVDNSRGYEMTVTGSGFNNGTTVGVYVLGTDKLSFAVAKWWNTLDCEGMKNAMMAAGVSADDSFCFHYVIDEANMTYSLPTGTGHADYQALDAAGMMMVSESVQKYGQCGAIVEFGTEVGGALVGSDDKVAVTFEVTAPTFIPGNNNYICMVDGEGRASNRDVEDFNLEPSIKVVPSSANSGDTVNVFAQDFSNENAGLNRLLLAGQDITGSVVGSTRSIGSDGSGEVAFEVPGGFEGTLRIDARWGDINEDTKITLAGAQLNASKTEVLPNETITITGNGFGSQTCIPAANITLDNVPVVVDEESLGGNCGNNEVEVSNSGQFVATIILWPMDEDETNPTLIPGTHELNVEDTNRFSSNVNITIAEPTIVVTPDVAGPRDYITITGENWPVDNPENPSSVSIQVEVADTATRARQYTLFADAVGRITQEHRVHRNVSIPSTVQVKMTYGDVAKIGSFAVPASTIEVSPNEGQPGDMVTLTAGNMKVYTEVDYIEIGGTRYDDPGVNTDRDGNVTVEDTLIPGLDPGTYSVVINVDGTIAIGEVDVLAESSAAGAPAELPGAVESLGDSVVAIFHFDDVGKEWSFYDPRPEFSDLNTLTEMVNGEAYWILVSETVEDVVLNNKVRSLTCRGSDCWNLEVW